jgi:hypothetical protein
VFIDKSRWIHDNYDAKGSDQLAMPAVFFPTRQRIRVENDFSSPVANLTNSIRNVCFSYACPTCLASSFCKKFIKLGHIRFDNRFQYHGIISCNHDKLRTGFETEPPSHVFRKHHLAFWDGLTGPFSVASVE